MILGVLAIKKSRKERQCGGCGTSIDGHCVRLFGYANRGDPPYNLFFHYSCVSSWAKQFPKVIEAMIQIEKWSDTIKK
jgi:hypothetical protein